MIWKTKNQIRSHCCWKIKTKQQLAKIETNTSKSSISFTQATKDLHCWYSKYFHMFVCLCCANWLDSVRKNHSVSLYWIGLSKRDENWECALTFACSMKCYGLSFVFVYLFAEPATQFTIKRTTEKKKETENNYSLSIDR